MFLGVSNLPLLFRKIDHKSNWDNFRSNSPNWIDSGDVSGDLLKDLQTTNNDLSVYEVADSNSNLDKLISAMAANRQNLKPFYYILIERDTIESNNYSLASAVGGTLSKEVNNFHINIEKLSGFKLVKLAKFFVEKSELNNTEIINRVRVGDVLEKIINSIINNEFSINKLSGKLKNKVEEKMRAMN